MRVIYAEQYGTPCVSAIHEDSADAIIAFCRENGAIYHEDGPDDECFVVVLRPDIGPELYTEQSIRRSRS